MLALIQECWACQLLTGAVLLPEQAADPSNTRKEVQPGGGARQHLQSASGPGAEPNSSAQGLCCCPVQASNASSPHFEAQLCHCTWVKLAQDCIQGILLWPGLHGAALHDKPTPLPAAHNSSWMWQEGAQHLHQGHWRQQAHRLKVATSQEAVCMQPGSASISKTGTKRFIGRGILAACTAACSVSDKAG